MLSNSLFPRYSHSYVQANFYQPRFIVPTNSNCYPRVSSTYRPQPKNNNYPVAYPPNPYVVYSYIVNHSAYNHHDRTNMVLIAILILASLDLIFIRPLKNNN